LGFTVTQARAYAALCQLGTSTAKTISKESNIARQDIYRILAELEEMGFVEKTITNPIMFQSIPLEEALNVMMEDRAEKNRELQTHTQNLIHTFVSKNNGVFVKEPQFVLIPKGKACLQKGKQAIKATQNTIDCVTSHKRFLQMMFAIGGDIFEALNREVKIRFILDEFDQKMPLPKVLEDICKTSSCSISYISSTPRAIIVIYDKREVHIVTSTTGDFTGAPMLWSNNPSLVGIIHDYFETIWTTTRLNQT
jgi:sugar-specific transcriptional regulator TrmB